MVKSSHLPSWSTKCPIALGTNKYLNDDRYSFLNTVLSANQGVPWFDGSRGLGAMVSVQNDWFYMSGGFQDAKAGQEKIDFDSFKDGKFVYLGELGITPAFGTKQKGEYKITVGYTDDLRGNSKKKRAYRLGFDHERSPGFFRYLRTVWCLPTILGPGGWRYKSNCWCRFSFHTAIWMGRRLVRNWIFLR